METKSNPSANGCLARALLDEPMFILLGRDPDAPGTIRHWAVMREGRLIDDGLPMEEETLKSAEADAHAFEAWRAANEGKWRDAKPTPFEHPSERVTSLAGKVLAIADSGRLDIEELRQTAKSLAGALLNLDPKAGQGGGQ